MSKMRHLLRKLHIGGNEHHRLTGDSRSAATSSSSSSSSSSSAMVRNSAAESVETNRGGDAAEVSGGDFFEEEYQVQLALAISASDPNSRDDPESVQIKAAERMSLAYPPSMRNGNETLIDFLSLRYWNYVVNYDEKVIDGFYDVYGITSNPIPQGKMPLLMDLQAMAIRDNVDLEVISVNRLIDPELRLLEKTAYVTLVECQVMEGGTNLIGLIKKIADLVVDRMGGPVEDADEMLTRWTVRSYELRNSLNSIILPLGCLDVGLSRHRALLFKVLADRINLPCRLVKGSYCTGTDEGAVNLVKLDAESEYIIDLMGAPGTLIPAEIPSSQLPSPGIDARIFTDVTEPTKDSCLVPEKATENSEVSPDLDRVQNIGNSWFEENPNVDIQSKGDGKNLVEKNQTEKFEHEFGKLLPSLRRGGEGPSCPGGKASSARKMKVKDVSKYVINASKNPEFAQKLHAVLLESGATPPPHLFLDEDPSDPQEPGSLQMKEKEVNDGTHYDENQQKLSNERLADETSGVTSSRDATTSEGFVIVNSGVTEMIQADTGQCSQVNNIEVDKEYVVKVTEIDNNSLLLISCNAHSEKINTIPEKVAEWEVRWEDLHIGERIGIGSYGEVYRGDLKGSEVAVKKFLDQDFSGAALVQFKCEIEIMLRLRHPNIVLFMGAVTQPPNLSILTEFLPRGSLYKLLHRNNALAHLDERRRLRMALDVAKGMNYLHTSHPTIVHRDLKTPNLLVDKNWNVKVSDFGLSRIKHHTFLSSKSTAGTPEWMAPEVLRNERANEKCDVYSFGVILWELATMEVPWSDMNPMQVVGAVGFQNRRLLIPEYVDPTIGKIIRDCWENDQWLRPSFSEIMMRLKRLQHLRKPEPQQPRPQGSGMHL